MNWILDSGYYMMPSWDDLNECWYEDDAEESLDDSYYLTECLSRDIAMFMKADSAK